MAAAASPTKYDPKNLFRDTNVDTSDVTEYTAETGERGTRVMALVVVNKTSAPVLISVWREASATNYAIAGNPGTASMSVPANGLPVHLCPPGGMILDADEELHAIASATGLDLWADGIEMD